MADFVWVAQSQSIPGNQIDLIGHNKTKRGAKKRAETSIGKSDLPWNDNAHSAIVSGNRWMNLLVVRFELGE